MNYSRVKYLLTSGSFIKKGKRKFFKKFLQRPFAVLVYSLQMCIRDRHMVVIFFLRPYLIMILNTQIGLNNTICEIISFMFQWEDLCQKDVYKRQL